jgi:hypothetical protein
MKKFDFYTRWGHGDMKDFVEDYAEKMEAQKTAQPVLTEESQTVQ